MVVVGDKNLRELVWTVVSSKSNKTITVEVQRVKEDTLYKKRFTVKKKFYAHDEENLAQEGDVVRIREARPMSKMKRWMLMSVVQKASA